ncbi:MAG: glycosyltransferase family 4 protein [Deltaproteobacteria bacterium]|nr:glycosyltransferase family 4 protein [Deltaproteobacteria bacterium]
MRVLFVHNYYQQPGGEDQVFAAESSMLEEHENQVFRYTVHNDRIKGMNTLTLAGNTLWNRAIAGELRQAIKKVQPDIVHFHNTFPLISPAAYYAARAEGVPVVQTLHNYRLFCPNALFFRDGHVCEECMEKRVPWPGILHACYRGSRAATGVTAAMLSVHRVLRTYTRKIDAYIALTDFARQKFIEGGIPAEKIAVKPNFVDPDAGVGEGRGGYTLFVGRLSQEKGIGTLLSAWEKMEGRIPLKIVGDGPLAPKVAQASRCIPGIEWLGHKPRQSVRDLMKDATVLIFPSVCYENLSITILEAYSVGLPVISSNLGSMSLVIAHGCTGLHFTPGDPDDLAAQVSWIFGHTEERERMRMEARKEYEEKYTAGRNYEMLVKIYEKAISQHTPVSNGGM